MKKVYKALIASGVASFLPAVAFAATYSVSSFQGILDAIKSLIGVIFPVILAVAVIVVIWGIFKFILNAGDEEARKTGRSLILWGIVGIFLMLSVWGLVNILLGTFGLTTTVPTVPGIVPNS